MGSYSVFKRIREDIASVRQRDPAARSGFAVFFCYAGVHALWWYRTAHWLWRHGVRLPALWLSYLARAVTGIEIHPGATIGRRVFIDHGMGVVIGETAEIGDDVTLYQGVTLGGTSLDPGKRHPTLEPGVIVGAGAKVLGPVTLGRDSRVGSNAVVLKDVPSCTTVVGIPARPVGDRPTEEPVKFVAYGTPCEDLPDPVARAIRGLMDEVTSLRVRIRELETDFDAIREGGEALPARSGPLVSDGKEQPVNPPC